MKSCGAFETAASGEDDASIHAHANTRVARLFGTLAAESMLERDAIYCAVFPPGARHQASNSLSLSLSLSLCTQLRLGDACESSARAAALSIGNAKARVFFLETYMRGARSGEGGQGGRCRVMTFSVRFVLLSARAAPARRLRGRDRERVREREKEPRRGESERVECAEFHVLRPLIP